MKRMLMVGLTAFAVLVLFATMAMAATITGTNGSDNPLNGTEEPDTISGLHGHDWIYGLGGKDTVLGQHGFDRLHGDNGTDTLKGGPGNDYLCGGRCNGDIQGSFGGPGLADDAIDEFYGGTNDDWLFTDDGNVETVINCGDGYDTAQTDVAEEVYAVGCEVILHSI